MTKTLPYNAANIKKIYNNLVTLDSQGTPKDFEVRIDDFTVIQRTNDLSKFYLLQESITNYSSELNIILYKGKARRYDKYIFFINNNQSPDPKLSTEEYVNKKVEEILAIREKEREFKRLSKENISQQQLIDELKKENQELKAKNKGELKEMLQMLGAQLNTSKVPDEINGIPNDQLMKMIADARKKFGDEVFKDIMGIALITGQNPEIIKDVIEFINDKIQDNENK